MKQTIIDLENRVLDILVNNNSFLKKNEIRPQSDLIADLKLDSISLMTIVILIEKEFKCQLDLSKLPTGRINNVADLNSLVEKSVLEQDL